MEEGHSVWQFQDGNQEGYPKAVRVPTNAGKEAPDRAFYSAPMLRHVEVAQEITQIGSAAWQSCHQLQIVKLPPPSVVCLQDGCCALRQIAASRCVQFGRRVFAECCSLSKIGLGKEATNALAPGAQIAPFAFESCLALASVTFAMANNNKSRALPDGSFCGAFFSTSADAMWAVCPGHRRRIGNSAYWWGRQPKRKNRHKTTNKKRPQNKKTRAPTTNVGRVSSVLR